MIDPPSADDSTRRIRVFARSCPHHLDVLDASMLETTVRVAELPNPGAPVRVTRGSGRPFCLEWIAETGLHDHPAGHMATQVRVAAAFDSIGSTHKNVVGCLNDLAATGGLELVVADEEAPKPYEMNHRRNKSQTPGVGKCAFLGLWLFSKHEPVQHKWSAHQAG